MPAAAPNVDITIGTSTEGPNPVDGPAGTVPDDHLQSYVIERDMYQPDMAAICLTNQGDIYSTKKIGDAVEVLVGSSPTSIFKGEIVGLEPVYKGGEKTKIIIRAVNKMHMLLRKRKSVTFTDKTDEEILKEIVKSAGLNLKWTHDKTITYKHVYQHNQTDLEFLRTRAARLGCHVWCVGEDLYVQKPNLSDSLGIKLSVDKDGDIQMRSFSPRLSSAGIVKKVTVKGWNPETKELIVGEASAQDSPLGKTNAVAGSGKHGKEDTFTVDHPIWSKDEADALAQARLRDLSLTYITGEAECAGSAEFELGKSIEIQANATNTADPFNGKYYIMGITHRHTLPKAKEGGYVTILKLARDAQEPKS